MAGPAVEGLVVEGLVVIAARSPTARQAFEDGRDAALAGRTARGNPHHDWLLGVCWATGWHWQAGLLAGVFAEQAAMVGLDDAMCDEWGKMA